VTSAWHEYLEAAQRLDTVRRDAASAVAAQQAALRSAREELPAVHARLVVQQRRLGEMATHAGTGPPDLLPGPAEAAAANRAVAGGPLVILAALRQARSNVDLADAALAQMPAAPSAQLVRNLSVYGALAAVALIVQIAFVLLVDARTRPFYAGCTGFLLAALSFGIGWVITGVVSRSRNTPIGLAVCALPLAVSTAVFTALWLS
jgi:hypothetical protein